MESIYRETDADPFPLLLSTRSSLFMLFWVAASHVVANKNAVHLP